jgi:hypothetical protein
VLKVIEDGRRIKVGSYPSSPESACEVADVQKGERGVLQWAAGQELSPYWTRVHGNYYSLAAQAKAVARCEDKVGLWFERVWGGKDEGGPVT